MSEPTIKQLADFARVRMQTVMGMAPSQDAIGAMFETSPVIVANWRAQHAAFQQQIDELAAQTCEWCQGAGLIPIEGVEQECLRCGGTGTKSAA